MSEWQFWLLLSAVFFSNSFNPYLQNATLAYPINQFMLGWCVTATILTRLFV